MAFILTRSDGFPCFFKPSDIFGIAARCKFCNWQDWCCWVLPYGWIFGIVIAAKTLCMSICFQSISEDLSYILVACNCNVVFGG